SSIPSLYPTCPRSSTLSPEPNRLCSPELESLPSTTGPNSSRTPSGPSCGQKRRTRDGHLRRTLRARGTATAEKSGAGERRQHLSGRVLPRSAQVPTSLPSKFHEAVVLA